jgi:dihydrofolate reductase
VLNEDLAKAVNAIKWQAGKDVLIFGSPTAVHSLMELGLIDGFWILVHPVIFGKGIPLFKDGNDIAELTFLKSKTLSNGILGVKYGVVK